MNSLNLRLKIVILSVSAVSLIKTTATSQTAALNIIDTAARPRVFAPGIISSRFTEWATSFSPDGQTVYFCRAGSYWTICYSKLVKGQWQRPAIAAFSGKYNDTDPFVSPDGKRMFFISNRPINPKELLPQKNYHIWYVDHVSGDKWSDPVHIDGLVNIAANSNYAPSVSKLGTLYFCARGRDDNKGMSSYSAKWLGDHYEAPQRLILLGNEETQDPFIAPDESYLMFLSGNDIYFCRKDGLQWATAEKLGVQVNNGDGNSSPYVSADGKVLYYSSGRVKGFYKRDYTAKPLNYEQLEAEMAGVFNSNGNILMIPIKIPSM